MLLDDIIALLSDQKGSLEAALLKTKVLLHQINHKELVPWVNYELAGYPEDAELPPYRIVTSQPHGHLTSFTWQVQDWVLPTGHLKPEQKKIVRETKITSAIGTIEQHVKMYREKGQGLIRQLPPELIPAFQKVLENGVNIMSIWCTVNMADVEGIVVQVRSRLLDFCLELQGVVGVEAEPQQLQEKAAAIDAGKMFQMAIFNKGGTIIVGSQGFQVTNQKEDIDGLIAEIAKLGFAQSELVDLRKAVFEDKSRGKTPDVTEGETGKWYTKALKEAGKGAVKAGIDVVSSVIVKAIKAYTTGEP
ncbi:MAG: hypothetical protein E6K24_06535 [Gammaproteobacteria bacterium]|nr:MAG: hypothetical protein E6K24_06535 [Gammaproteobacteria bacterium]